jgi:hypothetical protein
VNPRLVLSLFAALLSGLMAAGAGVYAGWHPLAIIPLFSFTGSLALVVFALVLVPGEPKARAKPASIPKRVTV